MVSNFAVASAFWTMIALQTLGSVDMPGKGERKLPSPRAYLAPIVLFSMLSVASDLGMERAAGVAAWVTVLLGTIKGPFGNRITDVINFVAPPGTGAKPIPYVPPDTSQ
jgi:hypothetical protein